MSRSKYLKTTIVQSFLPVEGLKILVRRNLAPTTVLVKFIAPKRLSF